MKTDYDVPTWDGDPGTFQTFEVACQWYEKTLKDTERRGAAARVWSRLTGLAKSVVKHLSPDEFDVRWLGETPLCSSELSSADAAYP